MFGQKVGTWVSPQTGSFGHTIGSDKPKFKGDKYNKEGKEFAASIVPEMKNLLNAAAGAIEAMGGFAALLNSAGQMYTNSDSHAAFADPAGTMPADGDLYFKDPSKS
jgi:hypothetical protein